MSGVVNCYAYSDGHRSAAIRLEDVSEILKLPGNFVWIGLHEPDEQLLKEVQAEFGLHDLAVEDTHRAHQRPKLETYGSSLFIVLRTIQMNQDHRIEFGETHFFIDRNFLVSVRHGSKFSYSDVRLRCESTPHLLRKGPAFALYSVMDSIVDQYFPVIDALEEKLETLEQNVFADQPTRETTSQIYELKRDLVAVKRAVAPMIDLCNRLTRSDLDLIPEDTRPYFRDIYDHVVRINETIDNTRELLTAALDANFSLISVSHGEVSRKIAAWAAIIGVPTMVAGIYGMNFRFMPELEWRWGYPTVLAVTISACFLLYRQFKQSGWL